MLTKIQLVVLISSLPVCLSDTRICERFVRRIERRWSVLETICHWQQSVITSPHRVPQRSTQQRYINIGENAYWDCVYVPLDWLGYSDDWDEGHCKGSKHPEDHLKWEKMIHPFARGMTSPYLTLTRWCSHQKRIQLDHRRLNKGSFN